MTSPANPENPTPQGRHAFSRVPPWLLVSAAWMGPALLATFDAYMQARMGNRPAPNPRELLWTGGDWLLFGLITPLVFYLARRYPLERQVLLRNGPLHLLAALGGCALWAGGGILLRWLLFPAAEGAPTVEFSTSWFFTTLPFGVAVYFAVLGGERAIHYFSEARVQAERSALLSQQLSEARLDALRMQLHPHFLFNSLNAVTVLLRDGNTAAATRMLEELGELLREVLRTDPAREVALATELEFIRRYLGIEQVRFPERLRPVFRVDPEVTGAAVPHFVLQPLVENALRHAIAQRADAGLIEITARREADDLVLAVRDDGPGLDAEAVRRSTGLGLANTRERLHTLYGLRGGVELTARAEGGAQATVRLPFRLLHSSGEATRGH